MLSKYYFFYKTWLLFQSSQEQVEETALKLKEILSLRRIIFRAHELMNAKNFVAAIQFLNTVIEVSFEI